MALKSPFLIESMERGFIHQCTDLEALDHYLLTEYNPYVYIGVDATAKSLHVGNLVGIMWLRLAQKHGIRPIVLLGGGTTQIGDPSGTNDMRKILDKSVILDNLTGFHTTYHRFLTIGSKEQDGIIVNNNDWLSHLNYIDFLRDFGAHFTINRMLSFDSVKIRLSREHPLSFLEFNYMIFQAYDFLHLSRTYGCCVQMGGSDQWGNIINGVELIRRTDHKTAFGITTPLITTASGAKMGKTAGGAVWLNETMYSAYDYWQFWRNTEDSDVIRYLKIFTDLPVDEINTISNAQGSHINDAKKRLADEATQLAHGSEVLPAIHSQIAYLFEGGSIDSIPVISLEYQEKYQTLDSLLLEIGAVSSKGEVKRLAQGGGLFMNEAQADNPKHRIAYTQEVIKISLGKKKHYLIQFQNAY